MESTDRETENGYKCVNEMQTGGTHINFAEQNKLHELNIGFAEEIFLHLGMSDEKFLTWNRKMDNVERKEANCSQFRFDSNSPLDTSSLSITKEEMSLATETISVSSELAQDEVNSNDYKEEKMHVDFMSRLLYLNNLEEDLHSLDLSSFSETCSCDSDAEGSLMKDKNLSLDKRSSGSTGDQMINIPKKDKLKKEQWEDDAQVTEHSQIQQQHDVVEKQFDHVKALLQANQLLTEGLRTKLLQIWCNVRKNQAEKYLDDEMSEDDTESLDVFSGEESSVASGSVGDLLEKQQSSVIKLPRENGQTEGTNGHTEISHLEHNVNCFTDHIPITQLQVGTRCLGKVADLERDFEQHCVVPKEQITSPKYASSKTESVDRTSHKEQLVTRLESTTAKVREYKQKIMPARGTSADTAETVKGRLQKVQWQLSEIEEANRNLHFQIIKLNTDYSQIQEFHQSMTGDNKTSANQRVDLQANFTNTAAENEQMLHVISKLETRIEATLLNLSEIKMEKNSLERQFQSLKDVYNCQRGGRIAEKEQFKDCGKALSEGQVLRARSDREHIRTQNLKQEIATVRSENHRLQRVTEEEIKKSKLAMADAKRWKNECHKLTTEHQEKERQTNFVIQMLKTEMEALKDASEKKEKEMKQNMKMQANVILDMKLVHSDLSAKGPSDKGDCANSTCVKKTSQILSKIDGILSSMEGIFVCRESNNCSSGGLPGGDTGSKGVRDLKEMVPAMTNGRKHSKHEECAAIDSKVRESLGRSASSHKTSKKESIQKRIIKRIEECQMLAAENVKLHNCVKELVCKVNGFNKIIQYADQRLQMNNSHILRLEKKNSILFVALNRMARKEEMRDSSPGSTSDSSKTSEKAHCSRTEGNHVSEKGIFSAKGSTSGLKTCAYQNQKENLRLDNPEAAEGICSQIPFDGSSQPDIYSIYNRKDEQSFETETSSTLSEISQEDGDHSNNEEKNGADWKASYWGTNIDKSVPKEDILEEKTSNVVETEDADICTCSPIPAEGNDYTDEDHQREAALSCKQKHNQAVNHKGKSSDESKLLAAENVRLHTCVYELQSKLSCDQLTSWAPTKQSPMGQKLLQAVLTLSNHFYWIDGLNEIVQIADQRLWMFNIQIMGLEKKNSALIAVLNKKSKEEHRQRPDKHKTTENS